MRIAVSVFILLLFSAAIHAADAPVTAPSTYEIGDAIPGKRVAVMNLNVSGDYSDQVKEWLPALVEDRLLAEGWTLVVRGQRMEHIQQERNLPGIKPETKLPDNELLGATAFLEMNARIQVKDIQGVIGYKYFTVGDYAKATVDLNGQIVDPATGVLKSSIKVGGSASGLKTAMVVTVASDWRIGAGGYNIDGIRKSLVGKAADEAAQKLIASLKKLYPSMPEQRTTLSGTSLQPASTTIHADSQTYATILISLPEDSSGNIGDHYGVYRGETLIAELEITRVIGKRAEAKILSQAEPIKPTDTARLMPLEIKAE